MRKKAFILMLAVTFVLPTFLVPSVALAVDTSQVCGTDNQDYASAADAEAAGVDVSYEFVCEDPVSEEGLYEAKTEINFAGMLVEIGSTDIPTTLIVRDNKDQTDYTIEITADTVLGQRRDQVTLLSDWIPGDQIRVIGDKNGNTGTIEASIAVNLSIKIHTNRAANGWITNIDKENKKITYQWANKEHTFSYNDDTKFVVGLKNPASVDDLEINDRIRGRLLLRSGEDPMAKIVVVLRRGPELFMMIRTFRPNATVTRLDSTILPTTIQVRVDRTPGLRANDVNNLVGTEGTLVTVNITENTIIVRKYFGKTTLDEFSVGDKVHIVGRVNNDGTVDAKLLKNLDIWKTTTRGHAGVVTEVNTSESYLMAEWTPIVHLTKKKLKEKLEEKDSTVTAQTAGANQATVATKLKDRLKKVVTKVVGKLKRQIKNKKITIERIKHAAVKIKDLIRRLPKREMKVEVTENTQIVVGTNTSATLSDIQVGDKIRFRGTRHANDTRVVADTIVVVSSLPEIEDSLETSIDDINEVVSEIDTDDDANELAEDTTTTTEEEVDEEGNIVEEDDSDLDEDTEDSDSEEDEESDDEEETDETATSTPATE